MIGHIVLLALLICCARGNYIDGNNYYSLNAFSNFPYRRLTIPFQQQMLHEACLFLRANVSDAMIMDCVNEQLLATDYLVVAGLMMANNTADPSQQEAGVKLLNQVAATIFSGQPMLPLNDIWGYDDPITGRSYALVGASNGVNIVDVTVPLSPVSIFFLQGSYSLWRDIKVWNSTMYAVNDNNFGTALSKFPNVNQSLIDPWLQTDGLVIIDLSYALQPSVVIKTNSMFNTAHNIQVEHDWTNVTASCSWCRPLAYAVGVDSLAKGGFQILDLSNRLSPTLAGTWDETYIHDIVIQYRDGKYIGYAAAIESIVGKNPGLYFIDVTDPANPVTLKAYMAHYNATHNAWPTDDGKYLYVTHEEENAPVTIWDIEDLNEAKQVGEIFITPNNTNILAHNVHVRGNRLWISYYAMGSAVYDISDPVHPILIGLYDTSPDISSGMGGTWGIYPYSKNYLAYASDMSNGLYVLNLTSTPVSEPHSEISGGVIAFFIVSAIVHAVTIVAFIVLAARRCSDPKYRSM